MINILIVDDQKTIQEVLLGYIEGESGLDVIGIASDGQQALNMVEQLRPNIVLMDIEMPALDGLTATRIITERFVETQVLILSVHDEDTYLNTALQVGAKGYLLKNTPAKDLINAIFSAYKGYFQLGPGLLEKYLYKISQSQSGITEVKQMKEIMFQQSKLLEEMKTAYNPSKQQEDRDRHNQRQAVLEKQLYTLQYQFDRANKKIIFLQTFCILTVTAFVAIIIILIITGF